MFVEEHWMHHYKNLLRESNGRFGKSKKFEENFGAEENFGIEEDFEENLLFGEWKGKENEWGDEEDSGWKVENLNEEWVKKKFSPNGAFTIAAKYNKKRAIFKYLQRLDKNGRGKMAASLEAAKIVFINAGSYKATIICKWAAYWLKTGCLPPIYQGKHQKTVRLIDDEDIANRCKTWIRLQNDGVIPKAFKDFIENTLFVGMNITKKNYFINKGYPMA
ncbi:8072_t:CDS:2 [Funneliformis geosporum]|nr:8072_t:CDS:2 [Funneliformis geosporum]